MLANKSHQQKNQATGVTKSQFWLLITKILFLGPFQVKPITDSPKRGLEVRTIGRDWRQLIGKNNLFLHKLFNNNMMMMHMYKSGTQILTTGKTSRT